MPKYGPGVVDPDIYEEQVEAEERGEKYGPAVLDAHPHGENPNAAAETEEIDADEAEEILDDAAGEDGYATIAEFTEALDGDPEKVAAFLEIELTREGGYRKGALRALRDVEASEEGLNRSDVLEIIDDALED